MRKKINDSPIISKASIELGTVGGPEVSDKINSLRWKKLDKGTGTRSWYCQAHLESSGLHLWTGNKSTEVSNTP